MTRRAMGQTVMVLIIAAMIIVPFFLPSEQWLNLVSLILIWALFAIGFDLVFGVTGMLSFGHAALFGTGGYTLTVLMLSYQIGFLPGLIAAALTGALLAFGLGLFALRVSGLFFALLTLALAQMMYILASNKLRALTGGLDGIPGVPRPDLFGIDFYENRNYYGFIVVVFLIGLAIMALLRASPFGRALRAVQANDTRAAQLGYNVHALRQSAFVVSGAYAGVAGALLASLMFYISPQMLHWSTSGDVLIMTVLGGKGTLLGPILGVAVFELLKEELSRVTQYWYGILGLIFIFATIFLRNGIAGLFHGQDDRDDGGSS
ncbi:branched-chain amino acid ABC transporter permease [Sulfitobacter pseudonitzschiae]|uniref:Branched-chain amino acid ABC transporter permease n=1 Tax=Pseudosulfitobacter pseudonitzschiae TaxID=1402135 RepID=A0A9Q2RXM3_9RHOB|nr:branched-chain amino acid ABC transporter permease [Pseudosulfitobacter pseudonitzschiae]MBM1818000.1 branched-chain amino acid ABC transporter permease [Pseudosulfitobacter pseudonitzschiae]MBM1834815.1 branched-chain amino acid ABC transporter permease [Pseudosulfitobacter pseudonitzschiae]MBM1839859.1 branched-chain amino acid ABC transporter permease [Pseudosulfitobacter pseudonitzschiae]MBM1844530.1 branched-chain amino acid ABC transporter permease [Pseudosulfitobacter pseudonitzschiae